MSRAVDRIRAAQSCRAVAGCLRVPFNVIGDMAAAMAATDVDAWLRIHIAGFHFNKTGIRKRRFALIFIRERQLHVWVAADYCEEL